jgi:hypothetical protein
LGLSLMIPLLVLGSFEGEALSGATSSAVWHF